MTGAGPRDPRLDALRGFALAGILLVNIQSYLSGSTNAIGYLTPEASLADRVAFFLTAALVAGKFLPLFGMIDDIAVLAWLMKVLDDELNAFRAWRKRQVPEKLAVVERLQGVRA